MKRSESQSTTPSATYADYKRLELEMGKAQQETARLQSECANMLQARDAASVAAHQADDRVAELRTKLETLQLSINLKRVELWECKCAALKIQIAAEKAWIASGSPRNQVPDRRDSPEYSAMKAAYESLKAEFQACNAEMHSLDREIDPLIRETTQLTQQYEAACELLQNQYVQCVQIEIAYRKARIASDTEIVAKLEGRKRSKGE